MKVLGLTAAFAAGYHDASVALVEDGRVLAVCHEERISRVKHALGTPMPLKALDHVLRTHRLTLGEIDLIAASGSAHVNHAARMQRFYERKYGSLPVIELYDHHLSHSALAYFGSGFSRALVWTSDYSGEDCSGLLGLGEGGRIHELRRFGRNASLGVLFGAITQYLGFSLNSEEGKVMGLSAFAEDPLDLSFLVRWLPDGEFELNAEFFEEPPRLHGPSGLQTEELYSEALTRRLGAPRRRGEAVLPQHANVAGGLQVLLSTCAVRLVTEYVRRTGTGRLCLAGGTALNVLCNQKLREIPGIKEIYVPPMPGDDGIAVGAAYLAFASRSIAIPAFDDPYLGSAFDDGEIARVLDEVGVSYRRLDDPSRHAAEAIASGHVIAWFQGAAECGPRALGNRSILADPRTAGVRDRINVAVKYRETFRPFAPATLAEVAERYFTDCREAPYMSMTYAVRQEYHSQLQAITHRDGTARVQIVNPLRNPKFHDLISEFGKITGVACVLNTSFNTNGQPLVDGPYDAISTFFSSALSRLYIGSFLIEKPTSMFVAPG